MKSSKLKILTLITFALCGSYFGHAMAAPRDAPNKAVKLQQAYIWHDGKQERQIWLDPDLVAEFAPVQGSLIGSGVKSLYAEAVPVSRLHGSVRIWRLGPGTRSDKAVRNLRSVNRSRNYSPVLRDGPTATGRMRALPGNIIVYLNPTWDSASVNAWAGGHQLEITKKLEIGPNIYVIKTGPGIDALNTANTLYNSGEVIAAFPDWWEEVTTR
jgi:hypothetical protein